MQLKIYNTLSRKIETFVPIDANNIRMYVCGPTVYDRAHIGNARPAVVFDMLYRILKKLYPKVVYVRNITDIDDKIYQAALAKNISISDLTQEMTTFYHNDIAALSVLPVDIEPYATHHIDDMIKLIEKLVANKNAYCLNKHVFFDVDSFEHYGNFSKKNQDEQISGARVAVDDMKKNPKDFVLWKPIDDNFAIGWESPWGCGRPGWHIECSAMSLKYLGEVFDIHGGGIDLIFPHHENEIAQSCAISNTKTMAKYWIHNGHLNVSGVKMSKSLGNVKTIQDLLQKFDGEVIRLAFLMSHYAAPMNFSENILENAKNILDRWYGAIRELDVAFDDAEVSDHVFENLLNDMNSPAAICALHEMVDKVNKASDLSEKKKIASLFVNTCRNIFGLLLKSTNDWFCTCDDSEKQWIEEQIVRRAEYKKAKNFAKADDVRNVLLQRNILIEDTKDGTIWKNKG